MWLNELEKQGAISAAARAEILSDCSSLVKVASSPKQLEQFMKQLSRVTRKGPAESSVLKTLQRIEKHLRPERKSIGGQIGAATAVVGGLAMTPYVNELMKVKAQKSLLKKDITALAKTKAGLMSDPDILTHPDKADARFKEVVDLSPSFASQPHLAVPFIKARLHSGLTDHDTERLTALQAIYTPSAELQRGMHEKTSSARLGETLATTVAMFKEAGIGMDKIAKSPGVGVAIRNLLTILGASGMVGVGSGAVKELVASRDRNKLQSKLEESFQSAVQMSDPDTEPLHANKEKARQAFQTLVHFSPHAASDPSAARAFIRKLMDFDIGIQTGDIKDLSEIERNLKQTERGSPFFTGLAAGADATGFKSLMSGTISKATEPLQHEIASVWES